jgi:hypothetical protein
MAVPSANGSDDKDDCSGDAKETEEANKNMSDPDPDPESGTKAGPEVEPVTPYTIKREYTCDYYENVIGLNKTASYALFVDQSMTDMKDFLRIKPENIDKICTAITKQQKTTIPDGNGAPHPPCLLAPGTDVP